MASKRKPSGLTKSLRDEFDALLLTWPLLQAHGEVVTVEEDSPNWVLDCEERCGDQHYADRKTLLDDILTFLDKRGRTDFAAVAAAIQWARNAEMLAGMRGRSLDRTRTLETERDRVHRYLTEWLPRALQLCHDTGYADPKNWTSGKVPPLVQRLEELIKALQPGALNPLTMPWLLPGSTGRRPRRGAPGKSWKMELQRKLARAGVPQQTQISLLIATGLLPYSDR